jgi:hypothetical protein
MNKFWIARDKRNAPNEYSLWAFNEKPTNKDNSGIWVGGVEILALPSKLFPEITFENSPKRVELKILEDE